MIYNKVCSMKSIIEKQNARYQIANAIFPLSNRSFGGYKMALEGVVPNWKGKRIVFKIVRESKLPSYTYQLFMLLHEMAQKSRRPGFPPAFISS